MISWIWSVPELIGVCRHVSTHSEQRQQYAGYRGASILNKLVFRVSPRLGAVRRKVKHICGHANIPNGTMQCPLTRDVHNIAHRPQFF